MRTWIKRHQLLLIIGFVSVLFVFYVLVDGLSLNVNAIAAGASAIAAFAALAAAAESGNTAKDAIRALSYATKPTISAQFSKSDELGGEMLLLNQSPYPIGRLRVSWKYRDGSKGSREYGYIPGISGFGAPPRGTVTHAFGNVGRNSGTDAITIDYWGTSGRKMSTYVSQFP
ncbi:hypothetical protein E3T26_13065 [Cryobacterium sp. TMT1-21]|uniref:hypothetical protein n=1 Tax=Cryobacterium sp. TMT1-21 TaxID=1259234 RepID=UPI00106D4480|nr:hypothetical protein [Cryobacterium sp. TMT1-21]TFD10905.1 hypothetical protein E3T26_13065 [Cryobacterium sp. TMT1-21]